MAAAPAQYDYRVIGGDCLPVRLLFKAAGVPIDLTGYQARLEFTWSGGSLTLSSSGVSPRITLGGAAGTLSADLTGTETDSLRSGRVNKYQAVLVEPSGCEFTPLIGYVARR